MWNLHLIYEFDNTSRWLWVHNIKPLRWQILISQINSPFRIKHRLRRYITYLSKWKPTSISVQNELHKSYDWQISKGNNWILRFTRRTNSKSWRRRRKKNNYTNRNYVTVKISKIYKIAKNSFEVGQKKKFKIDALRMWLIPPSTGSAQ